MSTVLFINCHTSTSGRYIKINSNNNNNSDNLNNSNNGNNNKSNNNSQPSQSQQPIMSPKKNILQKYNDDMDDLVIKAYSTRLMLTWVYNNSNPPILSAIPKLRVIPGASISKEYINCTLSPKFSSFSDIEGYVKEIYDLWECVITFFYTQHCKRSKAYYANVQKSTNSESEQSIRQTLKYLIISSIYYADIFYRKSTTKNFSILDIIITSINLTIKMWLEEKMSVNKYLSEIFGVSLSNVNSLEKYFLNLIDYQLYLHEKDVQAFSDIIHRSYLNRNSQNNNNNNSNDINNTINSNIKNKIQVSKSCEIECANKQQPVIINNNNNILVNCDSVNSSPLPTSSNNNGNTIGQSYHQYCGVSESSSSSSPSASSSLSSLSSSSTSSPLASVLVVPSSPIKSFGHQSPSCSTRISSTPNSSSSNSLHLNLHHHQIHLSSGGSPSVISPKKRYLSISRSQSSSMTNTPIATSSPSTCTVPNSIHHDDYQDQSRKRIKAIIQ
ncbi:hypothetical protein DICPUDRAFT_152293 [Dictyostelium purpureum]|uniref:Uncharacterized protein n=1 Tax=Dictyostelium purpureum TaxID=5786 RepID=F0ZKZ4_DICPU|nr:uncharacterized protein DICPUDRAFT_152293 [Dictyostelium purpureum]EGC35412.1 hypothetical protein DICPUDRAFT_152293 [Dictyostelium purpureum]|eukprot:XP_003288088.1 hypothetical protein DICPUDRAFT_152293 [Dictyostelium purpureum]